MSEYAPLELLKDQTKSTRDLLPRCEPDALAPLVSEAPTPREALRLYLQVNSNNVWAAVGAQLQRSTLVASTDQFASFDEAAFVSHAVAKLHDAMLPEGGRLNLERFESLLFPFDAFAELSPFLPIAKGDDDARTLMTRAQSNGFDLRCAQLFHMALFRSLRRMLPRFVDAVNAHAHEAKAHLIELNASELITSCPLDKLVAQTLVVRGVAEVVPDENATRTGPVTLRPVSFTWEGERDPKLWNWVRATPADASPEEVAAALNKGRENAPIYALNLAVAGPLFGLPTKWALAFPEAFARAPLPVRFGVPPQDDSIAHRLGTLAQSDAAENLALQQAPELKDAASEQQVFDVLEDVMIQLDSLRAQLAPWRLADSVTAAMIHTNVHRDDLRSGAGERVLAYAPVALGQRSRLREIGGAVQDLTTATTPSLTSPAYSVLEVYAEAVASANLATTCTQLMVNAEDERKTLVITSLQVNQAMAVESMSSLRQGPGGNAPAARELAAPYQDALDSAHVMEQRLMRGEHVDPFEMERTQLQMQEFTLRERLHSTGAHLTDIETEAEKAGEGVKAHIASIFSSQFRSLPDMSREVRRELIVIRHALDSDEALHRPRSGDADGLNPAPLDLQTRRAAMKKAQSVFDQVSKDANLSRFLASAYHVIHNQRLRTAIVGLGIDLALAFVTAGAANLAAKGAQAILMTFEGAEAVTALSLGSRAALVATRIGVDAALYASAQNSMEGTSFWRGFAQQALISGAFEGMGKLMAPSLEEAAAIARQAEVAKEVAAIEAAEGRAVSGWSKFAKAAGNEVLQISSHTVLGLAFGSIADKLINVVDKPEDAEKPGKPEERHVLSGQDVLLQSISVALGRFVHARIAERAGHVQRLARHDAEAAELLSKTNELDKLATAISKGAAADQALTLLEKQRAVIEQEIAILDRLTAHPESAKISAAEIATSKHELSTQMSQLTDASMLGVTLHLVGLHELSANALWSGSPEQVERAVREITRTYPEATVEQTYDGVRVRTKERTFELHEIESRSENASSAKPTEADHELSNLVVSIPGSESRPGPEGVKPSVAQKKALLEAAVKAVKETVVPGVFAIREVTSEIGTVRIKLRDGTWTSVEVVVARTDGTAVATLVPNSSRRPMIDGIEVQGEHVIQISDRLPLEQVPRVVAHAVGRLIASHEAAIHGEYAGRDGTLSPDDRGRIAELTVLARSARNGDRSASAELSMLTEYMGLRGKSPEAVAKLNAVRKELIGMIDIQITLETAIERDISPRQRELAETQLAAEHETHLARQPLHDAPASLVGRPGERISREDLARYADVVARLRRVKSNAKVAELRAQAKEGHPPVINALQLGAGAALAGRDPSAVLVDARGRWQSDASQNIAQVGQQLQDLFRARFGDVREVAGPGERVPIEAIRYWEDSLAVQGDVIDGYGTLRREGDKILLDIKPTDGSPPLTLEVRGKIELAPGFPSERILGGSFSLSSGEAVLELETAIRQLDDNDRDAAYLLGRLHYVKNLREADMTRIRDIWRSQPKDLQERVLAKGKGVEEALKQIEGQAAWNDLMEHDKRDGQRQIFFSKEANDETIVKEAKRLDDEKRTWVFAGAGGNAVSAAEIVLANTQNAHVFLFAKSRPEGLFENNQFRKMAELHGDESVASLFKQEYGVTIDISKSSRRMNLEIKGSYHFTKPNFVPGENGREQVQLISERDGVKEVVATGDILVSALGSPSQLPPDVAALALEARRQHWEQIADEDPTKRPVWVDAEFTADGRYIGYTVNVRIGSSVRAFEVHGAASREGFAPARELGRMPKPVNGPSPRERIGEATADDAHSKSGNFGGGLAPTALQTASQHRERERYDREYKGANNE